MGLTATQQAIVIVSAPEEMTTAASSGVEWLQQAEASWGMCELCQALLHSVPAGNMELCPCAILQAVCSNYASTSTAVHLLHSTQQVAQQRCCVACCHAKH